jgi:hypothetical protein
MSKRIYNTATDQTIWRGDAYLVDGMPSTVEAPLYLLDDVRRAAPAHDPQTQTLERLRPFADIETGEWVLESYAVRDLTLEELAALARKTWPNAAAFLGEFSLPELAAISLSTDPTIAALRLLLASWTADIWSDEARIQVGLAKLVETEIIDETRKAAILAK